MHAHAVADFQSTMTLQLVISISDVMMSVCVYISRLMKLILLIIQIKYLLARYYILSILLISLAFILRQRTFLLIGDALMKLITLTYSLW